MSYPSSEVTICNLALDHLNQASITSIETPVTKTEVLCQRWYDVVRRSTLRMHIWNFALKRATLAKSSTPPVYGFDSAYNLPNDYIRIAELGEYGDIRRHKVEGGQILIDSAVSGNTADVLYISYVYNFKVVNLMPPLFIDVMALRLALRLCMPITNNSSLLERIKSELNDILEDARIIDGQEDPPRRVERSRFKRARYGGNRSVATPWTSFFDD